MKVHNWQEFKPILLHTRKKILLTHLNLETKNLILDTHNLNLDMKFQNLDKREVEEDHLQHQNGKQLKELCIR
jgi:hypothetical protein